MVSGSSLTASQAYSSITVSPWNVRGLGTCFAVGGSLLMKAQSNDAGRAAFDTIEPCEDICCHHILAAVVPDRVLRPELRLAGDPDREYGRLLRHRRRDRGAGRGRAALPVQETGMDGPRRHILKTFRTNRAWPVPRPPPPLTLPLRSMASARKGHFVTAEQPVPQPVPAPLTAAAIFLVLTIDPGGEDATRALPSHWANLERAVGFRDP